MFPARYFPPRYFAPRYWPHVGAELAIVPGPYVVGLSSIGVAGPSQAAVDVAGQTEGSMAIAGPARAHDQSGG